MSESKADILMMFTVKKGSTLKGESTLQSTPGDDFMQGFVPVSDYDEYSNFFEVTNFNFSIKVEPKEQGVGAISKTGPHAHATPSSGVGAGQAKGSNDPFDRWITGRDDGNFPVKFGSFSFDRIIDAASPVFFENCANKISFESAVLVKRVATGDGNSVGFLRIELSGVMITSMSWNDGDMVTENCEATCKHMKLSYLPQSYAGGLRSGAQADAEWDREKNAQAKMDEDI